MSDIEYVSIDKAELKRLQADSAELARLRDPMSSDEIHNIAFEIARTDDGGGYYFEAEDLDKFVAGIRPIPEGFALVPVEPTTEMLDAAQSCYGSDSDVYRAMLAAAPSAKKEG